MFRQRKAEWTPPPFSYGCLTNKSAAALDVTAMMTASASGNFARELRIWPRDTEGFRRQPRRPCFSIVAGGVFIPLPDRQWSFYRYFFASGYFLPNSLT